MLLVPSTREDSLAEISKRIDIRILAEKFPILRLFEFARYLGVPDCIITKPPSADLWEGQSDEDDLGYTYAQIDTVLKEYVENRLSHKELLEKGFEKEMVDMAIKKIYQNQFKRRPPLIAKLTSRTIGHDFLYPRDIKL